MNGIEHLTSSRLVHTPLCNKIELLSGKSIDCSVINRFILIGMMLPKDNPPSDQGGGFSLA